MRRGAHKLIFAAAVVADFYGRRFGIAGATAAIHKFFRMAGVNGAYASK